MSNKETNIFTAKCQGSVSILKTFIDIMHHVAISNSNINKLVKQIYIKISDSGLYISSCNTDTIKSNIFLSKTFFSEYLFNEERDLCIGISLDIIKTCFKNVTKNDSMIITIQKEEFNNFPSKINVILNKIKGFSIKFNILQNIALENYDNFVDIADIPVKSIPNIFRELGGSKKIVEMSSSEEDGGIIKLQTSLVDIAENWITFPLKGKIYFPPLYLKCENFKLITKLSLLDNNVIIGYYQENNCLIFKSKIKTKNGEFGDVNILINSVSNK